MWEDNHRVCNDYEPLEMIIMCGLLIILIQCCPSGARDGFPFIMLPTLSPSGAFYDPVWADLMMFVYGMMTILRGTMMTILWGMMMILNAPEGLKVGSKGI